MCLSLKKIRGCVPHCVLGDAQAKTLCHRPLPPKPPNGPQCGGRGHCSGGPKFNGRGTGRKRPQRDPESEKYETVGYKSASEASREGREPETAVPADNGVNVDGEPLEPSSVDSGEKAAARGLHEPDAKGPPEPLARAAAAATETAGKLCRAFHCEESASKARDSTRQELEAWCGDTLVAMEDTLLQAHRGSSKSRLRPAPNAAPAEANGAEELLLP